MLWKVIANKYNHRMKFGSFHDDGGAYFRSLELEDNSKSDNKVLFFAPGSTTPVLYEGERTLRCTVNLWSYNCFSVGVLKRKELSGFIVSVIKGEADLIPKAAFSDAQPETSQDSEILEDSPVVHEEL